MIRIKESIDPTFKLGYIPHGWLDRALERPDAIDRKGIDIFKANDIKVVHGNEKADIGFSKHGDKVQGVSRNKCILVKTEPPIYNLYFGLRLNNPRYQKKFLAVMSNTKTKGLDEVHFNTPQKCFVYKNLFWKPKKKFLCTVLKNKNNTRIINNFIPFLRKYNKHNNMQLRIDADLVFCKAFGPNRYFSYGKGWNESCFHGRTQNQFQTFSEHKFTFAMENSCFRGYVTEKPIQAMCCGSIPIYLGAPDVDYYLPENSYIDFRKYTIEELCAKLLTMSEDEYFKRRLTMNKFVSSNQADSFSSYTFAKKIVKIIEERL